MIDAIYDGSKVGMSAMSSQWICDMEQQSGVWKNVSGLFFTHRHPDHYQEQMTEKYLQSIAGQNKPLSVYAPKWERSNVEVHDLGDKMKRIPVGNAEIITRATVHDGGEPWNRDAHETFLLKMGNETFFVSGDGVLDAEDAKAFQRYTYHIDIAFANLYQLGSEKGMECIHALEAERVFLYHLPNPENDVCHYLMMGDQAIKRYSGKYGEDVEIAEHMEWIL